MTFTEAILGLLNDVAQVAPAGRPFVRRLIDPMSRLGKAYHIIRLDEGCRADIYYGGTLTLSHGMGLAYFPVHVKDNYYSLTLQVLCLHIIRPRLVSVQVARPMVID